MEFTRDVRRTIQLGAYMAAWGMPRDRVVTRRKERVVEVYHFPERRGEAVYRLATFGVSTGIREDGVRTKWELLIVGPRDDDEEQRKEAISFLLDIMAFSQRTDVRFEVGSTFPESPLAPQQWKARAFLLDEPRGEPEVLEHICVGPDTIPLIWIVPIYGKEREYIVQNGLEAFDHCAEASSISIADPYRRCFVR